MGRSLYDRSSIHVIASFLSHGQSGPRRPWPSSFGAWPTLSRRYECGCPTQAGSARVRRKRRVSVPTSNSRLWGAMRGHTSSLLPTAFRVPAYSSWTTVWGCTRPRVSWRFSQCSVDAVIAELILARGNLPAGLIGSWTTIPVFCLSSKNFGLDREFP